LRGGPAGAAPQPTGKLKPTAAPPPRAAPYHHQPARQGNRAHGILTVGGAEVPRTGKANSGAVVVARLSHAAGGGRQQMDGWIERRWWEGGRKRQPAGRAPSGRPFKAHRNASGGRGQVSSARNTVGTAEAIKRGGGSLSPVWGRAG